MHSRGERLGFLLTASAVDLVHDASVVSSVAYPIGYRIKSITVEIGLFNAVASVVLSFSFATFKAAAVVLVALGSILKEV